jgi:hypothetical protein
MIDPRHPLAVLGCQLPWPKLEASIAHIFAHQPKPVETDRVFDFAGEFVKSKGGDPEFDINASKWFILLGLNFINVQKSHFRVELGGDVSNKGRPRLSFRLMIALTTL